MLSVSSVGNPTDFHRQGRKDEASFWCHPYLTILNLGAWLFLLNFKRLGLNYNGLWHHQF